MYWCLCCRNWQSFGAHPPQVSLVSAAQGSALLAGGSALGLLMRTVADQGALLVAQRAEAQERVGGRSYV